MLAKTGPVGPGLCAHLLRRLRGRYSRDMSNLFAGKAEAPSEAELAAGLGSAKRLWDRVCAELQLPGEWHSYSKKAGWSMRLKRGERNIAYLIPGQGRFEVSLVFGDRAVAAASNRGLAGIFEGAKRYAEGTAVRLPVKGARDCALVKRLVDIKLEF